MKWFVLLVLGFAACGPIQTTQAVIKAKHEIQAAKFQGSYRYAPYEYTKAQLYLRMAKEREGRSDFEAAARYGQESAQYAEQARKATKSPRLMKLRLKYDPDFKKLNAQSTPRKQEATK